MKEYRELVRLKFNNRKYIMYIDNQNKYFFLELKDGNQLSYIQLQTYKELCDAFCKTPHILRVQKDGKKEKKKLKLIPKILIGTLAVPLTLTTYLFLNATVQEIGNLIQPNTPSQSYTQTGNYGENSSSIINHISFDVEDSDEEFKVDTYLENEYSKYIYVYDNDYLDKILEYSSVSAEEMHNVVNNNSSITPRYKEIINDFIDDFYEKQPDAEKRILYENLKTLEVVECTKNELALESLSMDSYGCYIRTKNKIYVLKDNEYKEGTWEYQVIYHELCHAARTGFWDSDKKQIRVQCEGLNFYTTTAAEALNSIFAVSLFDYDEKDIAYQLQSNYFSVILDCMDNYKISDYMNHSLGYFVKKLDEFNGDNNYAASILQLMEVQFNDYHSDRIEIEENEYYPIYDYISSMYLQKYITPDMSYEECKEAIDRLVKTITFDVPEEYHIDKNRFYENADEYCKQIGIEIPNLTR